MTVRKKGKVQRYMVFAYNYESGVERFPEGGWNDFQGSTNNLEEARHFKQLLSCSFDFASIVDLTTGMGPTDG